MILQLGSLNVITGPNGCGKTNLYRSLRLLSEVAHGNLLRALANEGGFESILWAGPEKISKEMIRGDHPVQGTVRRQPVALKIGFVADPQSYCFDLGLPIPIGSMFDKDPELKRECLWSLASMDSRALCADRRNSSLRCRKNGGTWQDIEMPIPQNASMLTEYADPFAAPELILMRDMLQGWRFYDGFRCDADAPARRPSVQTFTPILAGDGSDLAAAIQTIREIGDREGLDEAINDAFPGSEIHVDQTLGGMQVALKQPGMLRSLCASELSDGTLRYLLLVAALYSPRPPSLLVLNEPETSLHGDLIPALGRMIESAAKHSQVIVVSHNVALVEQMSEVDDCMLIRLTKRLGETIREESTLLDQSGWQWPKR